MSELRRASDKTPRLTEGFGDPTNLDGLGLRPPHETHQSASDRLLSADGRLSGQSERSQTQEPLCQASSNPLHPSVSARLVSSQRQKDTHVCVFQGFLEVRAGIYGINISVQPLMQDRQIAAVLILSFLSGL